MDAYKGFAQVYDELMDDFDYPAWAAYYMQLLEHAGVRPETLCDCACGTGSMTVEFAPYVKRITGMDISQDMLEIAREKAFKKGVRVQLACMDMCALALPRPVDAIVCACDGVNYLTDTERVRAFFRSAYRSLKPGGALAFDISSAYKLRTLIGNAFFGEERDNVAYLWQNTLENDIVTMDLSFFIRRPDKLYMRVSETHHQRAHEVEELTVLLKEALFTEIQVYGDCTFDAPKENEQRIHILAKRR